MARKLRSEPPTEPGFRPRTRAPLFVDATNFAYFHKRLDEIARDWPIAVDEHAAAIRSLRENARDHLRAEMRTLVSTGAASYLIAV